jgi:hypothetical protein
MSEDKTYTKEEVELHERVVKLEQQVIRLTEKLDTTTLAVRCHSHKNSEGPLFDYIQ